MTHNNPDSRANEAPLSVANQAPTDSVIEAHDRVGQWRYGVASGTPYMPTVLNTETTPGQREADEMWAHLREWMEAEAGVAIAFGGTMRKPVFIADGFVHSASIDMPPVEKAVVIARLRAIADALEQR